MGFGSKVSNLKVKADEYILLSQRYVHIEINDNTVTRNVRERKKMDQVKLKELLREIPQLRSCKSPQGAAEMLIQ